MTESAADIDRLLGDAAPLRVWVERRSHPVTFRLAVLGAGLAGLAVALTINALVAQDLSWLVLLPLAVLAWANWALGASKDQRWALVVELQNGTRKSLLGDSRPPLDERAALIRQRCAPPEAAAAKTERLAFLDAARAVAIVLMVFAHFTDQLLDPALHATAVGKVYAATRGFTAPLFFVVSGWAFAVAVLPHALTGTADLPRRLRRGGLLLFWGYVLTLPWWAEGFPFTESAKVWLPFWTAGVLQTLGLALLFATVLLWGVRRPAVFLALMLAAAVLTGIGGPWLMAQAEPWHPALRGYFDPQGVGGGFPVAPWAGYFFAGIALGGGLWLRKARALESGAALGVVAAGAWLAQLLLDGEHELLVWRFACVAAVLSCAALLSASRLRLPLPLLGQHALTYYVAHMVMLWGAPSLPGLVQRVPAEQGWFVCAVLTILALAVTSLGISVAGRTKDLRLAILEGLNRHQWPDRPR